MTIHPGIVVVGASGRMGRMLIDVVNESDKARLVGAVEREGHDWIGQDLGEALGGAGNGITVTDDPLEDIANAESLTHVMLGGRLYESVTMNEIETGESQRLPYWWE